MGGVRTTWVTVALTVSLATPAAAEPTPWAAARQPTDGSSAAIGGTSAGCLAGAVRVPISGKGLRVMRPGRRRHYTHRVTLAFLRSLGAAARREKLGAVALGDLSQPRGGPAPNGHSSHQTGLDVDIWYAARTRRGKPDEVPMVDQRAGRPTRAWAARHARLVELAASDQRVDRVFVHPVLKRALCDAAAGDRAWLRKVRPWWGHDDHFHVRLTCPAADTGCTGQGPIAEGDGCAELAAWLAPPSPDQAKKREAYQARVGKVPELPARCADLLP